MNAELHDIQDSYFKALICADVEGMTTALHAAATLGYSVAKFEHLLLVRLAMDIRREYTGRINRDRLMALARRENKRWKAKKTDSHKSFTPTSTR